MELEPLGELKQDPDIDEWLVSEPVSVAYIGGRQSPFVVESIEDDGSPGEFTTAIKNFLALAESDQAEATPYLFQHYRRFVEAVGCDHLDFVVASPSDIWAHVKFTTVCVARRFYADRDVYVRITGSCDWDEEHGLQIVFRRGNILARVSGEDGHLTTADAYALPEERNTITYEG